MKIGIDFDGTVANTSLLKQQYVLSRYRIKIAAHLCDRTTFLRMYDKNIYENITSAISLRTCTMVTPPVPGAIAALRKLVNSSDLFLVSARPKKRLKWAEEWLEARGLRPLFTDIISCSETSKNEICLKRSFSALIDDDIRHFETVKNSFRGFFFKPMTNITSYDLPKGTIRVHSWHEVLNILA